jgi:hypothetical protein
MDKELGISCEGTIDRVDLINIHHFHLSIIVEMIDIDKDGHGDIVIG